VAGPLSRTLAPILVFLALALPARAGENGGFEWRLPAGFPPPAVPAANPMSAAKVELGRHLFYDRRLSVTGEHACASCHRQELAFADGRARALGATGELHPRSASSLANTAYAATLGWDDPALRRLERQALVPIFNDRPVELGLTGHWEEALQALRADERYGELFPAAFPEATGPLTLHHVTLALAAFERTLISGDSPFDRWLRRGEPLDPAARRGMKLFYSPRLACSECHRGFNFSGPVVCSGEPEPEAESEAEAEFHNTGLYDLDGRGAYPEENSGLHRHTGRPADMGRFRAPTLRNVELTEPYMHDGSVATLAEAIDLYARGGRTSSPLKSELLRGFELSAEEKSDLLAFLHSLTDRGFVEDPRFADPWPASAE